MKKILLAAIACAIGATACSHERHVSDAQLSALLRPDSSAPPRAHSPLDEAALLCLRGWSGDAELLRGLPMNFAGEDGKKVCRSRLDGWLADTSRNPDKFAFADVSAPKTVRQAIALQGAAKDTLSAPGTHSMPPGLAETPAPMGIPPMRAPDATVNLGVFGAQLSEAESLCQQVQQAATAADARENVKAFAGYCAGALGQLRGRMEQTARRTPDPAPVAAFAASADKMSKIARGLLAGGK